MGGKKKIPIEGWFCKKLQFIVKFLQCSRCLNMYNELLLFPMYPLQNILLILQLKIS